MTQKVVKLRDLTPEQQRLVLALIAADKSAKEDKEKKLLLLMNLNQSLKRRISMLEKERV